MCTQSNQSKQCFKISDLLSKMYTISRICGVITDPHILQYTKTYFKACIFCCCWRSQSQHHKYQSLLQFSHHNPENQPFWGRDKYYHKIATKTTKLTVICSIRIVTCVICTVCWSIDLTNDLYFLFTFTIYRLLDKI